MAGGLFHSCPICNGKIGGRWKGLACLFYAKSQGICTGLGAFLRTSLKYIIVLSADTLRIVLSRPHRWRKRALRKLLKKIYFSSSTVSLLIVETSLTISTGMKLLITPISRSTSKCNGSWHSRRLCLRQSFATNTLHSRSVDIFVKYGNLELMHWAWVWKGRRKLFKEHLTRPQ